MQFQENFSLGSLNTFGIATTARYYATFSSADQLAELVAASPSTTRLVLGGGSNILFTGDFNGVVLKNEIKGIEKLSEDADYVYVKSGAGEGWHSFVLYAIANGWAGVENLSLIPGCIGASPMQNIGAYGVEIKDVFHQLTAFHIRDKVSKVFSASDCEFGYRESVFKRKYKDQFIITDVSFKLKKRPTFNTSYGAINKELETMGVKELSIAAISQAIINIRSSKLPDPKKIGNAGSFFKNPSIPKAQYDSLRQTFPGLVGYSNADGTVKLAAGWLIEHSGPNTGTSWKGYRDQDAGVHVNQALVLVNYGGASGKEIYTLSERIVQSVNEKYGVELECEVNII